LYSAPTELLPLKWTVSNRSPAATSSAWTDAVYLSKDDVFSGDDTILTLADASGDEPVAAAGTYFMEREVVIPQGSSGRQFLFFVSNIENRYHEADANNNVRMLPIHFGPAASIWHNFRMSRDANNDGQVSSLDALVVINELNKPAHSDQTTGRLLDPADFFFDINADQHVTSLDSLMIINELNSPTAISGEGEDAQVASAGPATLGGHEITAIRAEYAAQRVERERLDSGHVNRQADLIVVAPRSNVRTGAGSSGSQHQSRGTAWEDLYDLLARDIAGLD
jgi:hypothetical protein